VFGLLSVTSGSAILRLYLLLMPYHNVFVIFALSLYHTHTRWYELGSDDAPCVVIVACFAIPSTDG
jgi:hypothetical protein